VGFEGHNTTKRLSIYVVLWCTHFRAGSPSERGPPNIGPLPLSKRVPGLGPSTIVGGIDDWADHEACLPIRIHRTDFHIVSNSQNE
jgi:hypothetical protein